MRTLLRSSLAIIYTAHKEEELCCGPHILPKDVDKNVAIDSILGLVRIRRIGIMAASAIREGFPALIIPLLKSCQISVARYFKSQMYEQGWSSRLSRRITGNFRISIYASLAIRQDVDRRLGLLSNLLTRVCKLPYADSRL